MLSLFVVRHGETDWNVETRVQGWTDIPLNTAGQMQAHRLGQSMSGIPFHGIIASDLSRAQSTARILSSYTGCPVSVDEILRERGFGSAEGMPRKRADELYPGGAPDAEPIESIDGRAERFLDGMIHRHSKGRFLCVTHGGFVRAIMRTQFSKDVASPPNTSVTSLVWESNAWTLCEFGATPHL